MMRPFFNNQGVSLLVGAVMAVQVAGQTNRETLVSNSPFGNTKAAATEPAEGKIEFRGVFVDAGETFINVYETATARSMWVGLNEPGQAALVKAYDAASETITVVYRGKELIVPLKQARVALLPLTPAPGQISPSSPPMPAIPSAQTAGKTGPVPTPSTGPTTLPMVTGTEPSEAAEDLARIADEIRKRRNAGKPLDGPKPEPLPAKSTAPLQPPR